MSPSLQSTQQAPQETSGDRAPPAPRSLSPSRPRSGRNALVRIRLSIEYCEVGNYAKLARGLLGQIRQELRDCALDGELLPSHGGVFEVKVEGRLIYSKRATSRFPELDEILYHASAARTAALAAR